MGAVPLRVFWYSEPSFSAGIETAAVDGVKPRVYSPEKTIANCFKYRNKIGLDVAMKRYARTASGCANPAVPGTATVFCDWALMTHISLRAKLNSKVIHSVENVTDGQYRR